MTKFEEGFLTYILMKYGREPFNYMEEIATYRMTMGVTGFTYLTPKYMHGHGHNVRLTTEAFKHFERMKDERPNTV